MVEITLNQLDNWGKYIKQLFFLETKYCNREEWHLQCLNGERKGEIQIKGYRLSLIK